ncbi:MAG: hypothetical protein GXP27_01765 [Planctomycetes bacterium]|nr:hypothetical protein [Planctomycetota bacterium]
MALAALKDRRPARLEWAVGRVPFAHNRRRQGGPVDHSLPALRVTTPDGRLRAVLVRYACHCTTLTGAFNRIHGDWAGVAQAVIEEKHPGAVAMVAIGCGADANPQPRGELKQAIEHGREIAAEVERLLAGVWKPVRGPVVTRRITVQLPFAPLPSREEWQRRAQSKHFATAYHAKVYLARLDAGQKLPTHVPYPVQV